MWFWDIFTDAADTNATFDIVYSQDIGLASEGHVTNNEAYNAHYIDHKVFQTDQGHVICSRQNQQQPGGFPYVQQGALGKTVAFSVDGFPFFGLEHKFDGSIHDLHQPMLNNRVYQYEFAFSALQSEEVNAREDAHITFYGAFLPTLAKQITAPIGIKKIRTSHAALTFPDITPAKKFQFAPETPHGLNDLFSSAALSIEEIQTHYPIRRHEEIAPDGQLLSFFTPEGAHVVLAEKERHCERPHGHIITNFTDIPRGVMASTNYIYGVFDAQIVLGNTTFNALNTHHRCGLNTVKKSGRRLMVKINGTYKLLTMPAAYEMGLNYARWLYKLGDDTLTVTTCIGVEVPVMKLSVSSALGKKYDFMLCDTLMPGMNRSQATTEGICVSDLSYERDTLSAKHYPDLSFSMTFHVPHTYTDDAVFYADEGTQNEQFLVVQIPQNDGFVLYTKAYLDDDACFEYCQRDYKISDEIAAYSDKIKQGMRNFHLSIDGAQAAQVDKYNDLALWYSHNARVHYASPHGLEQSGGAAWGLRDVCQGPFEYFLATQNYEACRHILRTVYAQQYLETGNWPQWFMFDDFRHIQHHESHGDIILWPLKALNAYLEATEDFAFLDTPLPYTHVQGYAVTDETASLLAHVQKQIAAIEDGFIKTPQFDTHLSCYGGGDWDDTLQPARRELAQNMVSGWTVALTYQVFREFAAVLRKHDDVYATQVADLAGKIKADYYAHLIKDGVAAGFLLFDETEGPTYLLHPADAKTGIKYRLLPMIRGMISEIFSPVLAERHYALIREYLYHPDGVRLMDMTPTYHGGENHYFMRAETSASFAREVSLHYIHAHIRFIEAMAKTGRGGEAWLALNKINPILLNDTVPNAAPRQSNTYFTSSDAAFDNRYDAMAHFGKIKTGEIAVKSGWRLYSSGPGIYLHQLISHVLGLRIRGGNIVLDPVLPVELDGLRFQYEIHNQPVAICYRLTGGDAISRITINGAEVPFTLQLGAFRNGGAMFPASYIKDGCSIEVTL